MSGEFVSWVEWSEKAFPALETRTESHEVMPAVRESGVREFLATRTISAKALRQEQGARLRGREVTEGSQLPSEGRGKISGL